MITVLNNDLGPREAWAADRFDRAYQESYGKWNNEDSSIRAEAYAHKSEKIDHLRAAYLHNRAVEMHHGVAVDRHFRVTDTHVQFSYLTAMEVIGWVGTAICIIVTTVNSIA